MRRFASTSPSETHSETLLTFPLHVSRYDPISASAVEQLDGFANHSSDTIAFKLYSKA
jgi:hypothetical protein